MCMRLRKRINSTRWRSNTSDVRFRDVISGRVQHQIDAHLSPGDKVFSPVGLVKRSPLRLHPSISNGRSVSTILDQLQIGIWLSTLSFKITLQKTAEKRHQEIDWRTYLSYLHPPHRRHTKLKDISSYSNDEL